MAVCRPRADLVDDVHRRLSRAGWLSHLAGGVVVFMAIGFLIPIFADPGERDELALLNGPPVAVYFVLAGIAIYYYMRHHIRRSLAWLTEGREPTDAEHRGSLRLAVREIKVAALAWTIGVVGFAVYNGLAYSWDFALMAAATVWAGAETTCALNYLIAERILRPVTALALQARPATGMVAPGVRGRLAGAWLLGTGVPLLGVVTVGVAGILRADVDTEYLAAAVLFLGLVAMASGIVATLFVAKAIAGPVIAVRRGLERIEDGDLDASVEVDDGSEVGLLQAGFNQMAEGLRERKRIRDLFGRQVGEDVAEAALVEDIRLGGEEREIGALFVDIQGSTAMAMSLPPTEVVTLLNRFFHVVVEVVESERGMVNKFEGDAALCVFGAPVAREDPAAGALRAADEMARRLARDVPQISFGIGVSAGIAVAGNVGSERRFEYTVIGDPVNEAARLSDLAKRRGEPVLASDAALERAGERERQAWEFTGSEVLRGRGQPTEVAPAHAAYARAVTYTASEGRQQVLDDLAAATEEIAYALASLGEAYEQVDGITGETLEDELFGPVQKAFGRARRTHAQFAERHGLPGREFEQPSAGPPSLRARGFVENASGAASAAGGMLASLQDSEVALEVGDQELRAGLADVRGLLDPVPSRARDLVRRLGR